MTDVTFAGKTHIRHLKALQNQERSIRKNSFQTETPPNQDYYALKQRITQLHDKENNQRQWLRQQKPAFIKNLLAVLGFKPKKDLSPVINRPVFKPFPAEASGQARNSLKTTPATLFTPSQPTSPKVSNTATKATKQNARRDNWLSRSDDTINQSTDDFNDQSNWLNPLHPLSPFNPTTSRDDDAPSPRPERHHTPHSHDATSESTTHHNDRSTHRSSDHSNDNSPSPHAPSYHHDHSPASSHTHDSHSTTDYGSTFDSFGGDSSGGMD